MVQASITLIDINITRKSAGRAASRAVCDSSYGYLQLNPRLVGSLFVARSQCSRAQRDRTAATGKTGEQRNSDRSSSFFSLTIETNVLKTLEKEELLSGFAMCFDCSRRCDPDSRNLQI